MFETLVLLLFGHAIADFGLQTDFMIKAKNRNFKKIDRLGTPWIYFLIAHGFIHGFFVWWVTGNIYLGLAETILHAWIDFGKGEKWFSIHADQMLHILCKLFWVMWMI